MARFIYRFRFYFLALGIAGICPVWARELGSSESLEEMSERLETETDPERASSKKRRRSRSPMEDMMPIDRLRAQRQMGDIDLYFKDGVAYRDSLGFKSGVIQLYPPFYEGWANGRKVKGLYEDFVKDGEPGFTLSSVIYNERYYRETGKEFVNYFILYWVPEQYAFTLFQPNSFGPVKDRVREAIVKARKNYARRDQFDTFQDYVAFKFGRDDEIANFVDGFWIEANEGDYHLTYFYTSEFLVERKRQAFVRPLIATTSFILVRGKLLKVDIVKAYDSPEDIPRLLEFTEGVRDDMKTVNRHGESNR